MRRYAPFSDCTRAALDFVCAEQKADLSEEARRALMDEYRRLPPYADAPACLRTLRAVAPHLHRLRRQAVAPHHAAGVSVWAFSNGESSLLGDVLQNARLAGFFDGVVSVEEVRLFKPAAAVYEHFLRTANAKADAVWLISANPFDIMGARAAGWRAVWVRRGAAVFDPWAEEELRPSAVISALADLPALLSKTGEK